MIKEPIGEVVKGSDLTEVEMERVMEEIMTGAATPANNGEVGTFHLTPKVELKRADPEEIAGGNALVNAQIIRDVLTAIKARREIAAASSPVRIDASQRLEFLRGLRF